MCREAPSSPETRPQQRRQRSIRERRRRAQRPVAFPERLLHHSRKVHFTLEPRFQVQPS
jgi:hypothetical protein